MIHPFSANSTHDSHQYCLLTGATGLLGRYLLRNLLRDGHRVAVVARGNKRWTAAERIESLMQSWETELRTSLPRPIVLDGDIRQAQLGLNHTDRAWVRTYCDRVLHGAAILQFFGDRNAEPWQTNLQGTENVLDLCKSAEIRQLHYISTAYVCGDRPGPIFETQLDQGQSFRNDYEHSKFLAEKQVCDRFAGESLTVYRPAVIIGDSVTGATTSYHGLFLYLRLLAMLVPEQPCDANGLRYTPIRLPFRGDEPRNLVPVDWVAEAISRLLRDASAHGKTFHLAPESGTTARAVIDHCYEYFHSYGVKFCDDPPTPETTTSRFAQQFFENTQVYSIYETSDPLFDRRNLHQHLPDLPCPQVDGPMIHRFLDFGYRDQWGKSKPAAFERGHHVLGAIHSLFEVSRAGRTSPQIIGFDVWGAGGGQWTISRAERGPLVCRRGLDRGATAVLRVASSQLQDLVKGELHPLRTQSNCPGR